MSIFFRTGLMGSASADPAVSVMHIHDYAERGLALGGQRLLIFGVALVLQAIYISALSAAISLSLIIVAEVFDSYTFSQARKVQAGDPPALRAMLRQIHFGALYGAVVISFFALSVAFAQPGTHYFMPMFFLVAAAVFTAMNAHQLASVLVIRLAVYGATFVTIPLLDLLSAGRSAGPDTWLNFFTSLFVLYFIVDCARVGMRYYRTNRRQVMQLRAENERTNAALAAKTEFLSTISHELRTPLTSIRGALDLSVASAFGPMPDKATQVLGIAQRNANRLGKLIDELLDLQKMEVGKMKYDYYPVELSSLVADTVTDNRTYADRLEITLKMLPVDTDLFVRADAMRLEQVITNLLSNAAKFSEPRSQVTLGVSATRDTVRITVSDQGPGIDPADHDRIFDSFSQLDNSDTRKFSGTGLGLNISKRIVEAHGGRIGFEPNIGAGTTFYIELDRITPSARSASA